MFDLSSGLRLYAGYRSAKLRRENPARSQEQQLLRLLQQAKDTRFGRQYDFASIRSVEEYQRRVPLRYYENFWEEFWKPAFPRLDNCTWPGLIRYIAVSSGTTSGTTKYIPYSAEMDRSNHKAGLDLLVHHVRNYPGSRLFGGKTFVLGGSTDLVRESEGVYSGDLSGIAVVTLPWWAKPFYFPSREMALIKDWETKIDTMAQAALRADIRALSGVPAWMLILSKKLAQLMPDSGGVFSNAFPNLEMLVHGGVNFAPYHRQFMNLIDPGKVDLREVYPASEGFVAIADHGYNEGMRLVLDHGIFFEFVPVDELNSLEPMRHWCGLLEKDVNYAVVLSTCAGLWSYVLGDTVKFIETDPPRLLITGRTSYCLSAFGEHLIAEEIEDAISSAAATIGEEITDYSVGPLFPRNHGDLGGHLYVVEFTGRIPEASRLRLFGEALDRRLCQRNEDYTAHRSGGFGLKAPEIRPVKPGTFAAWMKSRGKLGGQNKVPRIITRQELFDSLVDFSAQSSN